MQKKGFTLVEILIVIFVISMGLILIIRGMSETHRYISESAQRTVALNLAKEGIEAVYNLRNSNWRKWSDKKNECRLVASPLNETQQSCEDLPRLQKGSEYVISEHLKGLEKLSNQNSIITDFPKTSGSYKRKIWIDSLWDKGTASNTQGGTDLSKDCTQGSATVRINGKKCGDNSAKEMRFCTRVDYSQTHKGSVQLCSIMTNFEQ